MAQLHAAHRSLGLKHSAAQKPCVRFNILRPAAASRQEEGSSELSATQGAQPRQREPARQRRQLWGLPSLQLNPEHSPKPLLLSTASAFLASGVLGARPLARSRARAAALPRGPR